MAAGRRRLLAAYFRRYGSTSLERAPVESRWVEGLDREQRLAVELALSAGPGALVVTGEGGSGKTQVLKALARALEARRKRMVVLAVTHRALHVARSRLAGVGGVRYVTLAKLLLEPRELRGAAVVVVEEASMVDDRQLTGVISALDPRARLVLVGDPHQLPPLSAGTPFRAALASGVPQVRLLGQYRQGANTGVLELARALRDRRRLERLPPGVHLHGSLANPLERLVRLALGAHRRGEAPLVLTWRRDDWIAANVALQRSLNPHGAPVGVTVMLGTDGSEHHLELRVGDWVAANENLRDVHFYNGMLARLTSCAGGKITIRAEDGREILLPASAVRHLDLGYCLTAHRAQGGEWRQVIVYQPGVVRKSPAEWYYTACTRARERVDIVSGLDREAWWQNSLGRFP